MVVLEDMGQDACVMIGCHELGMEWVSHLMKIYRFFRNRKRRLKILSYYKPQTKHTRQEGEILISMIWLNPLEAPVTKNPPKVSQPRICHVKSPFAAMM